MSEKIVIKSVIKASPADKAGIFAGDFLLSANSLPICDILDYKYHTTAKKLTLELFRNGKLIKKHIKKDEYEDLGLEFETYLMSEKRNCKNNCIFCFINQLPKGMRKTLYFKDDDARLSFLQGNYITLTNLTDADVIRIINMKLNINISVHTTNPDLRCKMLQNREAGEKLKYLYEIAKAGISINCQLVLCKGINDGDELRRSLTNLCALYPSVASIACVPAGLTKWRKNLPELELYNEKEASKVIDIIQKFGDQYFEKYGDRLVYPSDEFFITANRKIPDYYYYGEFLQYENGVGMESLLLSEFSEAVENMREAGETPVSVKKSIATGVLAAPLINELIRVADACGFIGVYAIKNLFFGESITVAGLVTGSDLISQLTPFKNDLGIELLIPNTMLRAGENVFLDDITISDVENALDINVRAVECGGEDLLKALYE